MASPLQIFRRRMLHGKYRDRGYLPDGGNHRQDGLAGLHRDDRHRVASQAGECDWRYKGRLVPCHEYDDPNTDGCKPKCADEVPNIQCATNSCRDCGTGEQDVWNRTARW